MTSVPALLLSAVLTIGVPLAGSAQVVSTQPVPPPKPPVAQPAKDADPADTDYEEPVLKVPPRIPATGFVMPDVPDRWNQATAYDGRLFSTRFSFVSILDYNAFVQDAESKAQVGDQRDEWDLRTTRLMFRGQMKFRHPVDYLVSIEVKGQDHVQSGTNSSVGLTDLEVSTSLGKLGRIKFGKIKEPFVYEMVGDAANLPHQERALSPFFASRGIGVRLTNTFADDRMSWAAGWYNNWWVDDQEFRVSANDVVGRLTGLPYWSNDGANYLHLAVGGRYVGADEGVLRYRGRPESNVSAYYVDSDNLVADHANQLNFESLWGRGPFLVSAESATAWVDSNDNGDPKFWGAYVTVSYVLTGEHRAYDKEVAYARRVLPNGKWGAWEIVGRYSHVDLMNRLVEGGVFDRQTVGLNWWATRRWKIGFDYGYITLDRSGLTGVTHAFRTRMQWAY